MRKSPLCTSFFGTTRKHTRDPPRRLRQFTLSEPSFFFSLRAFLQKHPSTLPRRPPFPFLPHYSETPLTVTSPSPHDYCPFSPIKRGFMRPFSPMCARSSKKSWEVNGKSTPFSTKSPLLLAETPLLFRPCFLNSTFTHTKKRFTPTHFSAFGLLFRPFLPNFAHKHVSKAPHPPS